MRARLASRATTYRQQLRWSRLGPQLTYAAKGTLRGLTERLADHGAAVLTPVLVRPVAGRVGSTFMMKLLSTSPDIVFDQIYPFENAYLTYLLYLLEPVGGPFYCLVRWPDAQAPERADPLLAGAAPLNTVHLDRPALQRDLLQDAWAAVSRQITAHSIGRPGYYAEKLSGRLEVKQAVADLLAPVAATWRVRTLDLVRDPRDIWASMRSFNDKRGFQSFGRELHHNDEEFLRSFVAELRGSFELIGSSSADPTSSPGAGDHLVVRYEDVIHEPSRVAEVVGRWLDTSLSAEKALDRSSELAYHQTSETTAASVGRWRQDVTTSEAQAITEALGDQMVRFGYMP